MKICQNCHCAVDDDAKFCDNCGGNVFGEFGQPGSYSPGFVGQEDEHTVLMPNGFGQVQQNADNYGQAYGQAYGQPAQGMGGYPQNYAQPPLNAGAYTPPYGAQGAVGSRQPKKSKAPVILAVIGGLFVFGIVALTVIGVFSSNSKNETSVLDNQDVLESVVEALSSGDDDVEEETKSDAPLSYEAGTVENGVYENKWADLRFVLPEGWAEATQSAYETYEDENTTCDFYAINESYELLAVVVIDLSSQWDANLYSESRYLKEVVDGIAEGLEVELEKDVEQYDVSVAGTDYLTSDVYAESSGVQLCITCSLRRIGDYIVLINCTSMDGESNQDILQMFEAAR